MGKHEKMIDYRFGKCYKFLLCIFNMLIVCNSNCTLLIVNVVNFWEISLKIPSLIVIESDHQSQILLWHGKLDNKQSTYSALQRMMMTRCIYVVVMMRVDICTI